MNPPGLEQLEKAQGLVERGPLTFAVAVFAMLFISMLVWHLTTSARHARELLTNSIKVETALTNLLTYLNAQPKPKPARARTRPREHLEEQTVRIQLPLKEPSHDDAKESAGGGKTEP